ncbi:MAG: septum formation protein Maf [Prevotella sp.]|nr:septum formation protein Maf [Prevotella sp.]
MKKIVLSSNSPRRKELLGELGIDFEVRVIEGIDETYPKELSVEEVPQYIAREKARVYIVGKDEVLLTADTVVVLGNKIMGKPHDEADAMRMLRQLRGKTHQVITGVCLKTSDKQVTFSDITDVSFAELTDEEIKFYVDNFRPLDKAGAYGIQEWIGLAGVTGIKGSYFNVVGLPVHRVYAELKKLEAI